jgi:hypothetical protein
LVLVLVSQPVLCCPSQLPNPGSHTVIRHAPVEHDSVAFARLHAAPHDPQLASEVNCVSQPLVELESQLPHPPLHGPSWQLLPKHVGVACANEHTVVHEPQCCTSADRSVSHPLLRLLSQLPHPVLQEMEQLPLVQEAAPLVLLQAAPQAPQWLTLEAVFVSQPFAVLPSQLPQPLLHAPGVQMPVAQDAAALGNEQGVPHVPQSVSVRVLVSQPLFGFESQFP